MSAGSTGGLRGGGDLASGGGAPSGGRIVVVLRPLAGPLTIGFLGLAIATFVVAGLNLGWVGAADGKTVALCVLAFTVPLQFLASIISFLARDGAAASGMAMLSGIWLAVALTLYTSRPGATSHALGLFLLAAMIAMWAPASAAASSKLVPALVLFTAGLRFGLTGVYELTGSETWRHVAGGVGLFLAGLAVYAAYGTLLEDVHKRTVLPMGRRAKGSEAVEGSFAQQEAEIEHEAGVRQQL